MAQVKSWYIISYDISNRRKLQRVHRFLRKKCYPLQYSVFLFNGSVSEWHAIWAQLQKMVNLAQDSLHGYRLRGGDNISILGRSGTIEGVVIDNGPPLVNEIVIGDSIYR